MRSSLVSSLRICAETSSTVIDLIGGGEADWTGVCSVGVPSFFFLEGLRVATVGISGGGFLQKADVAQALRTRVVDQRLAGGVGRHESHLGSCLLAIGNANVAQIVEKSR